MRNRNVFITQSAHDDLRAAARYIHTTLQNPAAATDLLDAFDSLVGQLEEIADVYPFVRDELAKASGYRWTEIGNYMVFFRIADDDQTVVVERIAYNKRSWASLVR